MAQRARRRKGSWISTLVFLGVLCCALSGTLVATGYLLSGRVRAESARVAAAIGASVGTPLPLRAGLSRPLPTPTFTVVVATPVPLASVPPVDRTAAAYLHDWAAQHYRRMYALLSRASQAMQSEQQFVRWYRNITRTATITRITTRITSTPVIPPGAGDGASVQVPFTVTFRTTLVGTFRQDNSVPLVLQGGQWRVDWRPGLFFNGLGPRDVVRLFPLDPQRGSILDRKGRPLATTGFEVTIGVVPRDLNQNGQQEQTLQLIGRYLHQTPAQLTSSFANQPADWFIPLGNVPGSLEPELRRTLGARPGVVLRRKPIRVYPQGTVASHIVGYVSHVTPAELKVLAPRGYTADDLIGRAGVERWANSYLAGRKGGILAIVGPSNDVIATIARRKAVPGDNVILTIDLDIQKEAEQVLNHLAGSAIVMDPSDNSVLALASYPNFDPNQFITGFTPRQWQALSTSPDKPFLDRPTEAAYPTGSIFKVITMSAGMEVLGIRPTATFDCNYWWHGPGMTLHNWRPEGVLNLVQSLTGSCDPTFYQIGLDLWRHDPATLSEFAHQFGLGQKTGINGVNEIAGLVPSPAWKERTYHQSWYAGDSVELAIGQSYLQATPIQMANAYSALANHGVRRSPLLVREIVDPKGRVVKTFVAQPQGRLPDSPATLAAIKAGMLGTTSTPLGTAYYAFSTYRHPMEAKTGSASNQGKLAHAWFVGYTPPDHPRYLILIMIEGRGESMQIASPMARRLMNYLWPNQDPQPPPR